MRNRFGVLGMERLDVREFVVLESSVWHRVFTPAEIEELVRDVVGLVVGRAR